MSQDNLKDIFNDAFAAESIPFDNAAWQEMNKLLIAQRRRKLFFGWFSGSVLVLTILSGLYFFFANEEASYMPRGNDYSYEEFGSEPVHAEVALAQQKIGQSTNDIKADNAPIEQNAFSTIASVANPQAPKIERPSAASVKTEKTINTQKERSTSITESIETPTMAASAPTQNTASTDEVRTASTQASALTTLEDQGIPVVISSDAIASNDRMEFMPIIALKNDPDPIAFEDRTIPNLEQNRSLNTYFNIGFSKSFDQPLSTGFSRWGQRGGIGVTYQLKNNFLVAVELSLARDMVNYEEVSTRTEYGYEKYVFEQTVRVNEMLLTELPILVYYRQNRLMLGTGIKLGYLLSSRIEEENSQTVTTEEIGFANWKDLNAMRISIPIDVNYQLNPTYFVGCRYHYGLNDVFDRTAFTDRNNRFDLYLKMNLTR